MKLILIGDGEDRARLEKLAHGFDVKFAGQRQHDKAVEEMSQSKATVAPSECWETFGLSAVESMSVGTPAVVSDLGALPDVVGCSKTSRGVEDAECGEVFEAGNAKSLAEAIRRLLVREDYDNVCAACQRRVEERYSEEANYRQLMEIYGGKVRE